MSIYRGGNFVYLTMGTVTDVKSKEGKKIKHVGLLKQPRDVKDTVMRCTYKVTSGLKLFLSPVMR